MNVEVLDLKEFLERVQDDKELLLELFDIYTNDYLNKRKLLDQAVKDKKHEEIRNIAHSLKGASGNISAKRLRETFYKMEEMGSKNTLTGIEDLIATMDIQFAELEVRIEEVKKELKK